MAQLVEENRRNRLLEYAKQRPAVLIASICLAVLLAGTAALGVMQAGGASGVLIERNQGLDPADGKSPDSKSNSSPHVGSESGTESSSLDTDAQEEELVVDVAGAVVHPMVVELGADSRVQDAIDAAGGLTEDADAARVNRAAKLVDGQQIYIPHVGEASDVHAQAGGSSSGISSGGAGGSLVNINTAGIDELDALSGVGPATAQAIIDEREANGPFASIEDIMRVAGIGEKKYDKLKNSICV